MSNESLLDEDFSMSLPCIRVAQPIGEFFVTAMPSNILRQITYADVRQMKENEMDTYLGIQRQVNPKRVKEIGQYVNTVDSCFPTAVILAVEAQCAEYDERTRTLTLKSAKDMDAPERSVNKIEIAKVLDGQHRIEGLQFLKPDKVFDINVSIFINMDIESQAYLFSVVNLAQTKVNKSLVYDLFEYAQSKSPQKSAHKIAVALDSDPSSPLYERIKRLGVATHGRFTETLTQATVVEALLPYLTSNAVSDRDVFLRKYTPKIADASELRRLIFRNMFIKDSDIEIAEILFNYFSAVRDRWSDAWNASGDGAILSKTNGFRALMRLLRPAYLYCTAPGAVVTRQSFAELFARASITDAEFNTDNFKPGSSGELALYRRLLQEMSLDQAQLDF